MSALCGCDAQLLTSGDEFVDIWLDAPELRLTRLLRLGPAVRESLVRSSSFTSEYQYNNLDTAIGSQEDLQGFPYVRVSMSSLSPF